MKCHVAKFLRLTETRKKIIILFFFTPCLILTMCREAMDNTNGSPPRGEESAEGHGGGDQGREMDPDELLRSPMETGGDQTGRDQTSDDQGKEMDPDELLRNTPPAHPQELNTVSKSKGTSLTTMLNSMSVQKNPSNPGVPYPGEPSRITGIQRIPVPPGEKGSDSL
jgi:hypothetical protein